MHVMTQEQRNFAERHHNLVLKYLHYRGYSIDEFYDVVVFGYLDAVQCHMENADIQRRFPFTIIAFQKMDGKIAAYCKTANLKKRKEPLVSLDAPFYGSEDLLLTDALPSPEEPPCNIIVPMIF